MLYRKLDTKGDMIIGHGNADYYKDTIDCVIQAIITRLRLLRGEWFLDLTEGTPYVPAVLGKHTKETYDFAIKERVLDTEGVESIDEYESIYDGELRKLTVNIVVNTVYGAGKIQEVM